jgi:hypothetical protein
VLRREAMGSLRVFIRQYVTRLTPGEVLEAILLVHPARAGIGPGGIGFAGSRAAGRRLPCLGPVDRPCSYCGQRRIRGCCRKDALGLRGGGVHAESAFPLERKKLLTGPAVPVQKALSHSRPGSGRGVARPELCG